MKRINLNNINIPINGKNYSLEYLYLDWFNNFITVSYFAEYYDITEDQANYIINMGRKFHA